MSEFLLVPLLLLFTVWPGTATSALAQGATATLSGTVVDAVAAVVPDVDITVLSLATRTQRMAMTDGRGFFSMPFLLPGTYRITARREGFTPLNVPEIVLHVNDQVTVRLEMKIKAIGEDVTVSAGAVRVSTSPAVATTIDRKFVESLPLNGRSFQSLILLAPGVTVMPGQGGFSVNGQRTNTNYFTVDGVSANVGVRSGQMATQGLNGEYPMVSVSGVTMNLVSADALEEFTLQTSSYAAEFGRQQGGQVQLVTRSGTNQFHGSLYEYFRDDALDANDWFANRAGEPKPPMSQHQFGGTLGGPVSLPWPGRDRTFFFFSHESQRLRLPVSQVLTVPSLRVRELATPAVRTLLDAFPSPDGPELVGADGLPLGTSPLTLIYSDPSQSDATSLRLDHVLNKSVSLYGRYHYAPSRSRSRNLGSFSDNEANTQSATFAVTTVLSPRMSHEVRFNYTRNDGLNMLGQDDLGGAIPLQGNPLIGGYTGDGNAFGFTTFYVGNSFSSLYLQMGDTPSALQRQYNLVSSLSLLAGAHRFKFGMDYRRLAPTYAPFDHHQTNTFFGEESLVNGVMYRVEVMSSPEVRPRFDNVSLYAQDTWQATPRLTLDLGVRWDINPAPGDANGLEPVLIEGVQGIKDLPNARLAPPGTPIYETFWTAFAPRLGAAYRLSGTSGRETVLRGGFGFYYDLGSSQSTAGFMAFPFQAEAGTYNVPYPFPADFVLRPPLPTVELPLVQYLIGINPELKLPYTLQWNVAVERSLGRSQSLSVSYVGSAARQLLINQETNMPPGDQNFPTGPRPNPNFGTISIRGNGGSADYHSLQTQFNRRLSKGLQALVSYTWSHALDMISVDFDGAAPELVRGNAAFDVRHNLAAAMTFALPGMKSGGALGAITRGWGLDMIAHAQSGAPVDVRENDVVREDGSRVEYRPDLVPGVPLYLDDPSVPGGRRFNAAALVPMPLDEYNRPLKKGNLGRNVFRGLPAYQVDLAIQRRFTIASRLTAQVRVEAFNVFNRPNFGSFDSNHRSPATFGVPTSTLGRSLAGFGGGLSSLYQIGGPRSMQLSLRFAF